MAKINKTNVRKKTTKNIEKERIIVIMKANINEKTNYPNFTRVFNLTGVDWKTLKRWWDKREEYASSRHKKSAAKLSSEKFKGKYPEMENKIKSCVCRKFLETCLHLMAQTTSNRMIMKKVFYFYKTWIEHYNYFYFI